MKNTLHFLLWLLMVCCWSCSSGGEDPIPTPTPKPESNKIEISGSDPVVEQKAGTATITFTTNAAWTASVGTSTSWLSVSPASGAAGTHTLTVTTQENDTYDERNATVTIKAGSVSKNITVTQKQKNALTITSNKVEIGAEDGEFFIEVKANVKFEYEIEEAAQSWITSDGSRALTTSVLKFKALENENTYKREGKIIIYSGEFSETVTIYQEGSKPTIVLTQNEYTVASEGETIKVELKSNVDYEIQLPGVNWIQENSSRAMSSATHYFEIAPNEEYDSRSAEILFINKENGLSEKVMVSQAQKNAIIIAKNEYTIEATGGKLEFEVNTNVEFEVKTSVDWIVQNTGSRGLDAKPLSFNIAANKEDEDREGTIIISSADLKQEIKVIQKAKSTFSVSQTEFNLPSDGGKFDVNISTNGEYTVTLPKVDWLKEIDSRATSTYNHIFGVSANEEYDAREAVIVFTHKETGEVLKVKVIQAQKNAIIIAKNEYTIEATGGKLEFEVNTNVEFEVKTSVDWIVQNIGSRSLEAKPLSFSIAENTSDQVREGWIFLYRDNLKQSIKVVQKSKTIFSLSPATMGVSSAGGDISVVVTTNGEYTVTLPDVDWLKETTSRSVSTYTHTFSVSANESYDARETEIVFTHKETGKIQKLRVVQRHKSFIYVEKKEYKVPSQGGTLSFNVKTNDELDIRTWGDWIVYTESRAVSDKTLTFIISKNTEKYKREGIIYIYGSNDSSIEIVVEQSSGVNSNGNINGMPEENWD